MISLYMCVCFVLECRSYVVGGPRIIDVVGGPPLPIGDISGHHDVTHAGL